MMKYRAPRSMTLLECLRFLYPDSSNTTIKQLLPAKRVWVNGKLARIPGLIVAPGTEVEVRKERYSTGELPNVRILHEDEHFLVTDKKEQFLSVATDTEKTKTAFHQVLQYLQQKDSKARIYVVHRLDFGTSGLLLFAKSNLAQDKLKELFAGHTIERRYVAVVQGHLKPEQGRLESRLAESQTLRVYVTKNPKHGKHAVTHYTTRTKGKTCSLLDIRLETGRRGQIRVQLSDIGHPIVGDHEYGSGANPLGRLCLHATKLEFKHPMTGKPVVFESRMPASFLRVLDTPLNVGKGEKERWLPREMDRDDAPRRPLKKRKFGR